MTGEPYTIATALKALSEGISAFWSRGALLLWCLTTTVFVVLIALIVGAHFHIGETYVLLTNYETTLALALLIFLVFSAFKTYEESTRRLLFLVPNETHSMCSQSRQADGRITTSLALRFQATNVSKGSVQLSAVRLYRPWVWRREIIANMVLLKHPNAEVYGSYSIPHNSLTYGNANIIINRSIGKAGKPIRAVIGLQDHLGGWHKLVFPHLPVHGSPN